MEVERVRLGPCRRPWSMVVEAGDSSSSRRRQRIRLSRSPLRPRPPTPRQAVIFDDDSDRPEAANDGRHGQYDADGGEEEVGVAQSESETEYFPLYDYGLYHDGDAAEEDVYHDGDAAEEDEQWPLVEEEEDIDDERRAVEEEYSDDEEPIRFVRRGGGGDQPRPQRVLEDGSDDDIPIQLLRSYRSRTVVPRPGSSTAPAAPAMAPPAPPERPPSLCSDSDSSSVILDATVAKINGADCGICYLPLKPPIFQCGVGHVVCSRCCDRMGRARSCHKCRAPMPGGYRRCHDMEQLVDSIRVPCPNAAHGCAARPAYHAREDHLRACRHAPCHCPAEACGFAGSAAALADHLAATAAHGWPCTTTTDGVPDNLGCFDVALRDGFNFVAGGAAATNDRFLLLLHVEWAPPFGRAVAAFCVHHDRAATARLKIISRRQYMRSTHCQKSELEAACTDLSNGMPDPGSGCFRFIVPRAEEDVVNILCISPPLMQ